MTHSPVEMCAIRRSGPCTLLCETEMAVAPGVARVEPIPAPAPPPHTLGAGRAGAGKELGAAGCRLQCLCRGLQSLCCGAAGHSRGRPGAPSMEPRNQYQYKTACPSKPFFFVQNRK